MRTRTVRRRAIPLIILGLLLSAGLLSGTGEEIGGIGAGKTLGVEGVRLAQYGSPVSVLGQLTIDGEPVAGTFFVLFYDPTGTIGKDQCGLRQEHAFPEGTTANGAQVAFIQHPNAIVTFNIAPSQFRQGYVYELPFLPEDPPGAGAVEFF